MKRQKSKIYSKLTNQLQGKRKSLEEMQISMARNPIIKSKNQPSQIVRLNDYDNILTGNYRPFDDIDTNLLKKNISEFELTDTSKLNDRDLNDLITTVVPEIIIEPVHIEFGTELYRTRRASFTGMTYDPYFEEDKEVWCAPPIVINMGRLNEKGEQVLYTSFDALTPIHEIRCEFGDSFALMKYSVKKNEVIHGAYICCNKIRNLFLPDSFVWTERGKKNWEIINGFIESLLSTKIKDEDSSRELYRITVLISKLFRFPNCEALLYPSVLTDNSFNLAVFQSAVHKLELKGLAYAQYHSKSDDPKRKGIEYDLKMYRLWADGVKDGQIQYKPFSNCEIQFNGLFKPSTKVYYKNDPYPEWKGPDSVQRW